MSESYFDGILNEHFWQYLNKVAKNIDLLNKIITNAYNPATLANHNVLEFKIKQDHRAFVDILLAYIHSPVQTRHGRQKLPSEYQKSFDDILEKIHLEWYVQKVAYNGEIKMPHRVIVSILFPY